MKPENKIRREIMILCSDVRRGPVSGNPPQAFGIVLDTDENVLAAYHRFQEEFPDECSEAEEEFRSGEVETGLKCEYSRYYEAKSVARNMSDGSWVGWTYWYGGGKHGEPGSVPWIEFAYDLDCAVEEKLVVVRTFTRKG